MNDQVQDEVVAPANHPSLAKYTRSGSAISAAEIAGFEPMDGGKGRVHLTDSDPNAIEVDAEFVEANRPQPGQIFCVDDQGGFSVMDDLNGCDPVADAGTADTGETDAEQTSQQ